MQLQLVLVEEVPLSLGVGVVLVFLDPQTINHFASLKPQAPEMISNQCQATLIQLGTRGDIKFM